MTMATILVVDDEQPLRDLLADLLESDGHRVIVARNGREALAIARLDRPDLVMSDVMMPLLNGIRLCQQLKAAAIRRRDGGQGNELFGQVEGAGHGML